MYILTCKYASRHNRVHFFDISTSKSAPDLRCFVHFDLQICLVPQRRARFQDLNFQKGSGPAVFSTIWLANVLRATTVCKFSFFIWPAGSAPAALGSILFFWKNTAFRDFPTFSRTCILSLLIFSISYLLPSGFLHAQVSSWLLFFLIPACDFHVSI